MTACIAVSGGVFILSIITLILKPYGTHQDMIKRRLSNIVGGSKNIDILNEDLNKPLSERFIKPLISAMTRKLALRNTGSKKGAKRQQNDKLKKMVHQAGMSIGASEYSLVRLIAIMGTAVLAGIIGTLLGFGIRSALGALIGAYAAYTAMRFRLTSKISRRRKSMQCQLPDVLDLLAANVEAGLGFEQALLQVIGHFDGPLIDELTITCREMTMGRPRREALTLFAERADLEEIKSFAGSIVQAEQLGISIKNVLRTQATAMRASRRNKVEEKAMKISVKILVPMVGFIFPVLLIVLLGPAAVRIIRQFMG